MDLNLNKSLILCIDVLYIVCFRGGLTLKRRIIFIFLILTCSFWVASVCARAENWTYFDTDKYGKWYYDKESLTGTSTGTRTVVFWIKVVHTKEALRELIDAEKEKGTYKRTYDSWNYSLSNYACECDKLTCGLQGSIAYNTKGDVLNTDSPSPITGKWEKPRAGSSLSKLLDIICRTKQ